MEAPTTSESEEMPSISAALKRASSVDYERIVPPNPDIVTEDGEANTTIRRCLSESQVVPAEGSVSSVSSETSSSSGLILTGHEVFPSLPDIVLQQLGLTSAIKQTEVLTDQDVENRFSALSLAFKTDKLTITSRHDRQLRQRDQAERNMITEVMKLKSVIHNLNYLCKDSESIEILGTIQDQVDVLQRSTDRVSSSAEIYGAVQQEMRVSKAIDVMLTHMENLKRMYEKEHAELEETKRVLLENNIVVENNPDTTDSPRTPRYRSLVSLVGTTKRGRRASIAAFARPAGSPDSMKTSNISLTFGESKNFARISMSNRRQSFAPSLSNMEIIVPGREQLDSISGGIKELAEGQLDSDSSTDLTTTTNLQNSALEENNNLKNTSRKSSHCDGSDDLDGSYGELDNFLRPVSSTEKLVLNSPSLSQIDSFQSLRESATDLISRTHESVVNFILPLNVDYVLIQARRCATVILLFAALWSLVSTFVPTAAQTSHCSSYSWYSSHEALHSHVGPHHYTQLPS